MPSGSIFFFSFNIFRSIETFPVKYSPEAHLGQGRKCFSSLGGRLLAVWHLAQTTCKRPDQLFMVCKALVEFVLFSKQLR